jgi:hypothetical protein
MNLLETDQAHILFYVCQYSLKLKRNETTAVNLLTCMRYGDGLMDWWLSRELVMNDPATGATVKILYSFILFDRCLLVLLHFCCIHADGLFCHLEP